MLQLQTPAFYTRSPRIRLRDKPEARDVGVIVHDATPLERGRQSGPEPRSGFVKATRHSACRRWPYRLIVLVTTRSKLCGYARRHRNMGPRGELAAFCVILGTCVAGLFAETLFDGKVL